MIYPNGHITLNELVKMLNSNEYELWFVDRDAEEWKCSRKNRITNLSELLDAMSNECRGEGTIAYDVTYVYLEKHPLPGESEYFITSTSFEWKYCSPYGQKRCYMIRNASFLKGTSDMKIIPLDLVCFDRDFNSTCFSIGGWHETKEGFEFRSCGSRLFEYIHPQDTSTIFEALGRADSFLEGRFNSAG